MRARKAVCGFSKRFYYTNFCGIHTTSYKLHIDELRQAKVSKRYQKQRQTDAMGKYHRNSGNLQKLSDTGTLAPQDILTILYSSAAIST